MDEVLVKALNVKEHAEIFKESKEDFTKDLSVDGATEEGALRH